MKNDKFEFEVDLIQADGKPPFDFENSQPPMLNERMLRQESERRSLIRQIRALRISSVLTALCLALFAFIIAPKSLIIAIATIVVLCVSMIGCGVITVLFYKNGYNSFEI